MKQIIICLTYFALLCMINMIFNNMKIGEAIVLSIITVCAFGLYKTLKSRKENGGKRAMKERVKIITDGEKEEVYIDCKKVQCTDFDFYADVYDVPRIKFRATVQKLDSEGKCILNDEMTKVLTEEFRINC